MKLQPKLHANPRRYFHRKKNPSNRPHIVKCLLPIAYIATAQSWSETYNSKTKYIAELLPPNCCWLCEAFNEFNPTSIFRLICPHYRGYAAKSNSTPRYYRAWLLSPSRRNTAIFQHSYPITELIAILPQSASLSISTANYRFIGSTTSGPSAIGQCCN